MTRRPPGPSPQPDSERAAAAVENVATEGSLILMQKLGRQSGGKSSRRLD